MIWPARYRGALRRRLEFLRRGEAPEIAIFPDRSEGSDEAYPPDPLARRTDGRVCRGAGRDVTLRLRAVP